MNAITIELDEMKLTKREEKITLFESFVSCLELFKPVIEKRFEEIEGVTGCFVGYTAKGFSVSVETKYPELRPEFIIEYKHIYLDMVDGKNTSPLVNRLNREVARCMLQVQEAIRNITA